MVRGAGHIKNRLTSSFLDHLLRIRVDTHHTHRAFRPAIAHARVWCHREQHQRRAAEVMRVHQSRVGITRVVRSQIIVASRCVRHLNIAGIIVSIRTAVDVNGATSASSLNDADIERHRT